MQKSGSNFVTVEIGGKTLLISYQTPIAYFDCGIHKLWDGWSRSSMNHLRKAFGVSIPKKEWEDMPLETLSFIGGLEKYQSGNMKNTEARDAGLFLQEGI